MKLNRFAAHSFYLPGELCRRSPRETRHAYRRPERLSRLVSFRLIDFPILITYSAPFALGRLFVLQQLSGG